MHLTLIDALGGFCMSEKRKEKADDTLDPSVYKVPEQEFVVQIKFKREAGVRVDTAHHLSSVTKTDLSSVAAILEKHKVKLEHAYKETEETLERRVAEAKATGVELPDLSRSYVVRTKDRKTAYAVAKNLAENKLVEVAEVAPPAVPADAGGNPSPSFVGMQGYLNPAPGGVDAFHAWTKKGGKGTGIKMIDIEGAWNFNHEDLLQNQGGLAGGTMTTSICWRNHGTNVLGEVGGDENKFGVTGIAPLCHQLGYTIFGAGNDSHIAIKNAADMLSAGDIILIELHRPGPDAKDPDHSQDGYIAIEWWTLDFDAIKYATAKGIIVVEAAGNGSRDLDNAIFLNRFDRQFRDSGAILVGAGAPPSGNYGPDRSRLDFSNWGSIIDAQGWGREVVSTGGTKYVTHCGSGNLQDGTDENKWYTQSFGGTSSASPIVTGVVACLQGIQKAKGKPPLTFTELRNALRYTGSPQQGAPGRPSSQRIGNRPDLKAAYSYIWRCFIATAAFGSELDPQVQFLRDFRDEIVLKSMFKSFFEGLLDQYYKFSPSVAKEMEENSLFRSLVKYSIVYPFVIGAKAVASCWREAKKMLT